MNIDKTGDEEQTLGELLRQSAAAVGGKNFFLTLVETIRETREGIFLSEKRELKYPTGMVVWNKTLFADNWRLLIESAKVRTKGGNILPPPEDRKHKRILNMIRTLKPLTFTVIPANPEDGAGFTFAALEVVDATTTRISPLFKALFMTSPETLRKTMGAV